MQEDLQQTAAVALPPLRDLESPTVQVVRPVKRRLKLRDVPRGAEVIRVLAARDFKVKYKQSVFGPLWLFFQPFALLIAFFVAFRNLANVQPGIPYSVFALAGLGAWAFFQSSMTIGTGSMITNVTLVRFTPCPRFAFPIAGMSAAIPSWVVTIAAGVVAAAVTGTLSPRAVLLPLTLGWLFVLTAGIVALLASIAVRYRDIVSAMPFLLQIALFMAPVGYPLNQLGSGARTVVELNPITGLIESSRWMLVSGYHPSTTAIAISLAMTPLILLLGWRVFTGQETSMADVI
jgi:lipopolysaccharide transport system permease protein